MILHLFQRDFSFEIGGPIIKKKILTQIILYASGNGCKHTTSGQTPLAEESLGSVHVVEVRNEEQSCSPDEFLGHLALEEHFCLSNEQSLVGQLAAHVEVHISERLQRQFDVARFLLQVRQTDSCIHVLRIDCQALKEQMSFHFVK